jgi:hypothetical protein
MDVYKTMSLQQLPGYIVAEKDKEIREAIFHSLTTQASNYLTICEQLRFIYDTVCQIPDKDIRNDLIEKLIDAFNMGKKMNARLARYKREYNDKTGSAGSNLLPLDYTEKRKHIRSNRNI